MKDVGALMQRALDGAWGRHEVLAQNVANAETPGYKRHDVDFSSYLKSASSAGLSLLKSDSRHLGTGGKPTLNAFQDTGSVTTDGNSVDIDLEMGEVSSNALYYAAVSRQMTSYLSLLRKAATEGRR